jgi:cysteinyl-tRNA synthetase
VLKLFNSLSRKIEVFTSIKPNEVSLYVCGITPYDTTHLGHAFTYISFDILVRVLKHKGFKVNYTQNVTDINDRDNDILKRAKENNISWRELSDFWTNKFLGDMKTLNWIKPNSYIKASDNIDSMINLITKLSGNGFTYQRNGSIYFDISKQQDFGKLSKLSKEKMLEKAKDFEEDLDNPDKKNPLDITLWRAFSTNQPAHIPFFDSPFGKGRPGWHIECSAMATSTLGDQIDIHGGGIDLIYPHHEAEIAQSEGATFKIPFTKFWMHTAIVSYQGKKMSKSLNNLIMISDLSKKYSPNVIRWYLLSHHYRESFEYFEKDIEKANIEFLQIEDYLRTHLEGEKLSVNENAFKEFTYALEDDLNTPLALKIIQQIVKNKGSIRTLKRCLTLLGCII